MPNKIKKPHRGYYKQRIYDYTDNKIYESAAECCEAITGDKSQRGFLLDVAKGKRCNHFHNHQLFLYEDGMETWSDTDFIFMKSGYIF